jgi:hypothetical protein
MKIAQAWEEYFLANRANRPAEPDWSIAPTAAGPLAKRLARSLAHFQLGESGDGSFLLEQAALDARSAPLTRALALFIAEEHEHARLLAKLVERFGGKLTRRHWTHSLFRRIRHASGLEFELSVLVIAEMVGTAYYRLLRKKTTDPVLRDVCRIVLRDEARHVEFHIDHLGARQAQRLPLSLSALDTRFQMLYAAAAHVAWLDHGACLSALGVCRREFFDHARAECVRFLRGLAQRRDLPAGTRAPLGGGAVDGARLA